MNDFKKVYRWDMNYFKKVYRWAIDEIVQRGRNDCENAP